MLIDSPRPLYIQPEDRRLCTSSYHGPSAAELGVKRCTRQFRRPCGLGHNERTASMEYYRRRKIKLNRDNKDAESHKR
jgi:hypothetical protein